MNPAGTAQNLTPILRPVPSQPPHGTPRSPAYGSAEGLRVRHAACRSKAVLSPEAVSESTQKYEEAHSRAGSELLLGTGVTGVGQTRVIMMKLRARNENEVDAVRSTMSLESLEVCFGGKRLSSDFLAARTPSQRGTLWEVRDARFECVQRTKSGSTENENPLWFGDDRVREACDGHHERWRQRAW